MQITAQHVKFVGNAIGTAGVSKVVGDIIRNNTTVETTADAVKVGIGSIVIGSMITDKATEHIHEKIDAINDWREERKQNKKSES